MIRYIKKVTRNNILSIPNNNCFTLCETDNLGNIAYTFEFINVPNNSVLLKVDEDILDMRDIFISSSAPECQNRNDFEHFLCKKADYILIDEENNVVFIIEMKSSSDTETKITAQLKGAFCILKYLEYLILNFSNRFRHNARSMPFNGFRYRFISIKQIGNPTKGNKLQDSINFNDFSTPERFLHLRGRNKITYHHLLNNKIR